MHGTACSVQHFKVQTSFSEVWRNFLYLCSVQNRVRLRSSVVRAYDCKAVIVGSRVQSSAGSTLLFLLSLCRSQLLVYLLDVYSAAQAGNRYWNQMLIYMWTLGYRNFELLDHTLGMGGIVSGNYSRATSSHFAVCATHKGRLSVFAALIAFLKYKVTHFFCTIRFS